MKKRIVVSAFLLFAVFQLHAQEGISFEKNSWSQIVQKAKAEKKLIFMDAYTSWCGPCKSMQAKVFPDATLGNYFNATFINAKFDMEKGEGPALAAKYPIQGYPTLMFIDPNTGKIVMQALGYRNAQDLINIGKQANARKGS